MIGTARIEALMFRVGWVLVAPVRPASVFSIGARAEQNSRGSQGQAQPTCASSPAARGGAAQLTCLLLPHQVVRVLRHYLVTRVHLDALDDLLDLPVRFVVGVIKENQTTGDKELVAMAEVSKRILLGMVAVYEAEAKRPAELCRSA